MRISPRTLSEGWLGLLVFACLLLAFGYLLISIWQLRGPVAAVLMVCFAFVLSFVQGRARTKADSIDYSRH